MTRVHPATYSPAIMDAIGRRLGHLVQAGACVLDPMAGTGKIAAALPDYRWALGDLEVWPDAQSDVHQWDARELPLASGLWDAAVCSPVYGNRMSDHHNAKDGSKRNTYKHRLGRDLRDGNAGKMRFASSEYRELHRLAWQEVWRVLRPMGPFLLNTKDFLILDERQEVGSWHLQTCLDIGFRLFALEDIPTPGLRQGANRDVRIGHETLWVFRKGPP